jgi:hypothetical protein
MRTLSLFAAAGALTLAAGAAQAQTPAERVAGISVEAYFGATTTNVDADNFEKGVPRDSESADFFSPNFGGAVGYRHGIGENVVIGGGVFLEGYSGDETTRDELEYDPVADADVEVREKTALDTAYGVRALGGVALDGPPIFVYGAVSYGWAGIEKTRKRGSTVGVYNDTTPFTEIAGGAEWDFADGAAVYVEVAHREFTDTAIQFERAANFGEFSADSQQARFGVRFHF